MADMVDAERRRFTSEGGSLEGERRDAGELESGRGEGMSMASAFVKKPA